MYAPRVDTHTHPWVGCGYMMSQDTLIFGINEFLWFLYLQILEDWRYIAMVIDRFQLYLFLAVTIGGTIGILINAPHIFEYVDQDAVKAKIMGTSPTEWIPDGDTLFLWRHHCSSSWSRDVVPWLPQSMVMYLCCLTLALDMMSQILIGEFLLHSNCTFSCTLPKSYEHTGRCWISLFAPEGRRMLDDLGEHQRSLCLAEVAKSMCGAFSRNRGQFEVEGFQWKLTFVQKIMAAISRFKTRVEKLGTEACSFTGKQ